MKMLATKPAAELKTPTTIPDEMPEAEVHAQFKTGNIKTSVKSTDMSK